MKIQNTATPVLVLNCKLGALSIMRSLGSQGVHLYGVDEDQKSPGFLSRYCRGKFLMHFDEQREQEYLENVIGLGKQLGERAILIPTSDELSLFVAKHSDELYEYFIFPRNDHILVSELISKEGMYHLARKHAIPTPYTVFPKNLDDVLVYADDAKFPIMLKGIYGNRLQTRMGGKKMVIVHSREELIEKYKVLEDPDLPNLMIQEYIPGGDDQIYIFNGYFNEKSECLAAFTGYKIRQFPVHVGCASLGVCSWNQTVADITTTFMRSIGYKGVLDIGYRLDPRDGLYKVLDINPRVGQAFRLFVAENGMDAVRSLYLNLTGQDSINPIIPKEGRRWVIEDFDIISSLHYHWEGTLGFRDWLHSFKGVEEGAWFSWKDPLPFLVMLKALTKKALLWLMKRIESFTHQR
jgi:predicted ATP-grasp superfamily ATP-dependent carboligase